MDIGNFNLFIKLVKQEYALGDHDIEVLTQRLLADDKEFEKVWRIYKNKASLTSGGVDQFKTLLHDLIH